MRAAERLQSARQERRLLSTHFLVLMVLALVILIAVYVFINSSFFAVGSVVVQGNKYITAEDVYRIAEIPERVNIFRLDTGEIQRRLLQDLRIAQVTVKRKFPATILIQVKERQPIAYLASSYGFIEVDKQGVVLAAFKNLKQMNVPVITGTRLGDVYVGDTVDSDLIKKVLQYLSLLDEPSLNQLSEVNVKVPQEVVAYTLNSVCIRLGGSDRLAEKAKLTNDILREINEKKMAVEYIDLNYASPFIKFK
ncbi:polypeptide-transport-associated ftsq-type [Lucifera butyrica]|uniref:Polypeptide-transport-associated ftsq-type n=1 Tax=Lucifera butyrica TaxID=1351585 RepID=A0A498R0Y4_9FIRM|nr:FtsQ-type POTRA domain-containing protein [Lucifera butyrica]VBB06216.1 polypeptide-transport-associated ftsq-type [Lucifera butyrica]